MNIRGVEMAAEARKLMSHPLAQAALKFFQALAVAIIVGLGNSVIDKLNTIISSLNRLSTDVALVQQQVNLNTSGLASVKSEVDRLKTTAIRLDMRLEQVERKGADKNER